LIEIEDDEDAKSMLKNELENIMASFQGELCSIWQMLSELVYFEVLRLY
jgi:hypothetical protein